MRNENGSALIAVMVGGVILASSIYSITRSFAGAYSFNQFNRSKTLAQSYVTELAEYLKAKPMTELIASMGNYPMGIAVNDTNRLITSTCQSLPTPTPAPQEAVDPSVALPKTALGGPGAAERGYIVNVIDLSTNQTVSLPCGTTVTTASQMLQTSSTLQFSFTVFVAWKNASGVWQRETTDAIGSGASAFTVSSNAVVRPMGTIQGQIVDLNLQPTSVVQASVTLDGGSNVTNNPYSFTNVSAENHILTAPNYSGYLTLYSVCVNCTNHPTSSYVLGTQVTITVPANGYVDVNWQYDSTQVTANLLVNGGKSVTIADSASTLLTWTSTNASSCALSRSDAGTCGNPASGCNAQSNAGLSTGALLGPNSFTYTLVCKSAYNSQTASSSVTVNVTNPAPSPQPWTTQSCVFRTPENTGLNNYLCPANFAVPFSDNGSGAMGYLCCPLPATNILVGKINLRQNSCNANELMVGVSTADKYQTANLYCQGVDNTKYKIGSPSMSCYWAEQGGSGRGSASTCQSTSTVMYNFIHPKNVPYNTIGTDGCAGIAPSGFAQVYAPFMVGRASTNDCSDQSYASLLDAKGNPIQTVLAPY